MADEDVAWVCICKRVWNEKLKSGGDKTRWCRDDLEHFLQKMEEQFKSSNMLLADCISNVKTWFLTQCTENSSMKLFEMNDDDDESEIADTDPEGEVVTKEGSLVEGESLPLLKSLGGDMSWKPRLYDKVLSPFPIDENPYSTMYGRKMESSVKRDDIHTLQDFEAMVVNVNDQTRTAALNYYGIGGYHPSVRYSVIKPTAGDGEREEQSGKGHQSLGAKRGVVTMSKKDCKDDLKLKLEEFAADRKKELDRLKADVMSEMHHQINEMKKEVTSTGLVMHGITGDLTDIKSRLKGLLEKAQQGKQLASMGSDKAIKDLQKSMASHEQKFNAVEIKVDTEVKRVEDMLTALSSNAATAESHEECMTRLEKVEDLVVGGKRKLDRIYTAIRTMAELENDVEKDTESEKDSSSVQMDEDKPEEELDGSRSPSLARRRGGGQGRGRGRPRGRGGGGGRGRFQVAPASSGAGEGA
tara:strand:+ start:83 stop:1492 length:1410 start_codon:yes stop_codon:yes gene_type:complete